MKKLSLILITLFLIISLSGCYDKHELEDAIFAVFLGVDESEDDNIRVTIAFPVTQMGKTEGPREYCIISAEGPTVMEALSLFQSKLAGPLSLYCVKTVAISRSVAEKDMLKQLFSSWGYAQARSTANVIITGSSAEDFIKARIYDPVIDPLRQEELLLEQTNNGSFYKSVQLIDLLGDLSMDGAVATFGSVSDEYDHDGDGFLAGNVPISGKNKSQICGLAVFRGSRMVGVLDSIEAQSYAMLLSASTLSELGRKKISDIMTVSDPLSPGHHVVITLFPRSSSKTRATLDMQRLDIPANITIDMQFSYTVEYVESAIDYSVKENYDLLSEKVREKCYENMNRLIYKIQKEYDADILGLGNKVAHNFTTNAQWDAYNWKEKYRDAHIDISVNLEIILASPNV